MALAMKVKKGDLVQVLSGKDRGKQGRVIEARPDERRVIVENLNIVKRHTKPRPMRDANRMGGTQMMPGGVIDKPAPPCPKCGSKKVTRLLSRINTEWLPSDVAWDRVGRSWD